MKNQRTIEEKYQKLDEISHCLTRPGRYLGSITPHTSETWVFDSSLKKMIKKEITWSPAFLKMFDDLFIYLLNIVFFVSIKINFT